MVARGSWPRAAAAALARLLQLRGLRSVLLLLLAAAALSACSAPASAHALVQLPVLLMASQSESGGHGFSPWQASAEQAGVRLQSGHRRRPAQ